MIRIMVLFSLSLALYHNLCADNETNVNQQNWFISIREPKSSIQKEPQDLHTATIWLSFPEVAISSPVVVKQQISLMSIRYGLRWNLWKLELGASFHVGNSQGFHRLFYPLSEGDISSWFYGGDLSVSRPFQVSQNLFFVPSLGYQIAYLIQHQVNSNLLSQEWFVTNPVWAVHSRWRVIDDWFLTFGYGKNLLVSAHWLIGVTNQW